MRAFDYRVQPELNLIEVRPSRDFTTGDIAACAGEILAGEQIREGTFEHCELSGVTSVCSDYASAAQLIDPLRGWLSHGWKRSVFFSPQEQHFAAIRMIEAMAESLPGASAHADPAPESASAQRRAERDHPVQAPPGTVLAASAVAQRCPSALLGVAEPPVG